MAFECSNCGGPNGAFSNSDYERRCANCVAAFRESCGLPHLGGRF